MGRPKEVSDAEILTAARACFVARGASVSAAEIGREIGLSHTTIFNRFGSKEGLMIAALAPPAKAPWIEALDAGPDDRPICLQLIEHGKTMSHYFDQLNAGLAIIQAAGISYDRIFGDDGDKAPAQSFAALAGWLRRAQEQKRIADCDTDTLAATMIGALHNWAFTARICGQTLAPDEGERHVERLIRLLWDGIGLVGDPPTQP